ncbi:MAG: antibiotic biosynthesis monooxygenase [Ilumatobacteraceae bacterium]
MKDDDALWFYEMYDDQAALDAHAKSEAFQALGPKVAPFLAAAPDMKIVRPIGGKGL